MKNWPLIYLDAKPPKLCKLGMVRDVNGGSVLDFIEHNAGRLIDPKQTDGTRKKSQEGDYSIVGTRQVEYIVLLHAIRAIIRSGGRGLFAILGLRGAAGRASGTTGRTFLLHWGYPQSIS